MNIEQLNGLLVVIQLSILFWWHNPRESNLFCSRPPPSFKEVTPSSRTNMRQLLIREQCLQREQKLDHQIIQNDLRHDKVTPYLAVNPI